MGRWGGLYTPPSTGTGHVHYGCHELLPTQPRDSEIYLEEACTTLPRIRKVISGDVDSALFDGIFPSAALDVSGLRDPGIEVFL